MSRLISEDELTDVLFDTRSLTTNRKFSQCLPLCFFEHVLSFKDDRMGMYETPGGSLIAYRIRNSVVDFIVNPELSVLEISQLSENERKDRVKMLNEHKGERSE